MHDLLLSLQHPGDTEITYLNIASSIKQYILQFDISVDNQLCVVDISQPFNYLSEEESSDIFLEPSSLFNIREQITTRT